MEMDVLGGVGGCEGVGPMMAVGRAVQRADASSPPGSIGQLERG